MSLTAYIQSLLEREVGRPSRAEIARRAMAMEPVDLDDFVVEHIRERRGPLPE